MITTKLIYRVQYSDKSWILRHPNHPMPLIIHADKEEVIKQLPHYFRRSKEAVIVKILDDFGRVMEECEYGGAV